MPEGFRIASAFVEVHAETAPLFAEVDAAVKAIAAKKLNVRVGADADTASAAAAGEKIKQAAKRAGAAEVKVKAAVSDPQVAAAVAALRAKLAALSGQASALRANVDVDDKAAIAKVAAIDAKLTTLNKRVVSPRITTEGLARAEAQMLAADAALSKFITGSAKVDEETKKATSTFRPYILGWRATGTAVRYVAAGLLELAAVGVPALVALTAATAALAPTFVEISQHTKAATTAYGDLADAQGRISNSTTRLISEFDKVAASVRPSAFQIYGSTIGIAGSQLGLFRDVAQQATSVIDEFTARLRIDIQSGSGHWSNILRTQAVPDMRELGQVIGNTSHAVANLLAAAPGLAEVLLRVADSVSKLILWVTKIPTPLLTAAIAMEEAHRWGGFLAGTLGKVGLPLQFLEKQADGSAKKVARFGISLAGAGAGLARFARQGETVAKSPALERFASWAGKLTAIPIPGWAIAAGAAVGGYFLIQLIRAGDAADRLVRKMQEAVTSASNFNAFTVASRNIGELRQHIDEANKNFQGQTEVIRRLRKEFVRYSGSLNAANYDGATYAKGLRQQRTDMNNVLQGAAYLMKTYGVSFPQALALADQADIKLSKGITGSGEAMAIARQQVDNYMLGLENMRVPLGRLGNDVLALEVATERQASQIPKLNQAWQQFTQTSQSAEGAFIALAESTRQTLSGLKAKDVSSLTGSFTKLEAATKLTGASFSGTNKASLQLQQQFQLTLGQVEPLIESFRTAQLGSSDFRRGVVDAIAPLVKLAGHSKAAWAELMVYARQAGVNTPAQLEKLVNHLGSTSAALSDLKKITDKATVSNSDLAKTARDLNTSLQQMVAQGMDKAKFATFGVQKAIDAYTQDLKNNAEVTNHGRTDRQALISSLEKAGLTAKQAKGDVDAFTKSVSNIKPVKQVLVNVSGHGRWNVSSGLAPGTTGRAAAGGGITPGYAPGSDTVPMLTAPGEGHLVPEAVRAIGPDTVHWLNRVYGRGRKSHGLIQGAGGGIIPSYSGNVPGLGQWTVRNYNTTVMLIARAVADATSKAMSSVFAGGGAVSGTVAQWIAQALKIAGAPASWLRALEVLVSKESGGNPRAYNPISVAGQHASGLFQTLPSTFASFSLGGSIWNPVADAIAGIRYIMSRYGSPYAIPGLLGGIYRGYAKGTGAAKKGWAWIGEHGPELAYLRGGETILPTWLSAAVGGQVRAGYAGGSLSMEQIRGLSVIQEFARAGSLRNILADVRHFLEVIARYYTGGAARWRRAMIERQVKHVESISKRLDAVSSRIAAVRQYQQDVLGGLQGFADLSSISQQGPVFGSPMGAGQAVEYQLQLKLVTLKQFGAVLRKLAAAHVPKVLIRQIVALGPEQGLQYANDILAGGPALIRQLSATERQIGSEETLVSQYAANAVFGLRGTGGKFMQSLRREQSALEKEFRKLAKIFGMEAARWFGVPRSKVPSFDEGGWLMPGKAGMNYGSKPEMVVPGGSVQELVTAIKTLAIKVGKLENGPAVHLNGRFGRFPNAEERVHLLRDLAFAQASIG